MEHIYRAFDGIEFSDENDCKAYEECLSSILIWDNARDPVTISEAFENAMDNVAFFKCNTRKQYEYMFNMLDADSSSSGLPFPPTVTTEEITYHYAWDSSGKWVSLQMLIAEVYDLVAQLNDAASKKEDS